MWTLIHSLLPPLQLERDRLDTEMRSLSTEAAALRQQLNTEVHAVHALDSEAHSLQSKLAAAQRLLAAKVGDLNAYFQV